MKRIVCLMAALAMLFALLPAALADGEALFYAEAPASASVGDTITVKVCLTGEYSANVLTMWLHYNSAAFKYLSLTEGEVLNAANASGNVALCQAVEDKSFIATGVMGVLDEGFSAQGVVFEARFQVLSASSNTEFRVEVGEFGLMPIGATTATPIPFNTRSATVSVGGSGGSPTVTTAPHDPTVTAAPTEVPGTRTEEAGTTAVPGSSEAAEESSRPTLTIPTLDPGNAGADLTGKDFNIDRTPSPNGEGESNENGGGEKNAPKNNTLLRVAVAVVGALLAAGLGILGVHFIKKGNQAHKEAAEKRSSKADK